MKRSLRMIWVVGLVAFGLLAPAGAKSQPCDQPVPTTEGPVIGKASPTAGACVYKGVPFAKPPVDELRLRAPKPPTPRSSPLDALEFGPACAQNESIGGGGKSAKLSEDCLYLNIWRPDHEGVYPVMFWIYGGGFTQGAASYEMYDGTYLASAFGVVVVSINYRLGPFGFLALPELLAEDPAAGTGNYGLLDQVRALQWTRDNIANFGGDPTRVTIFGESAGGVSVCCLLASPMAAGLFHRAIIESGACDLVESLEDGFKAGEAAVNELGCDGGDVPACLRELPAQALLDAKAARVASVHVDGPFLPAVPLDLIRQNHFNRVPIIVGSNRNEGDIMLALMNADLVPNFLVKKLAKNALGPSYNEIRALYRGPKFWREYNFLAAMVADGFGSRAFQAAEELAPNTPVHMYRFDWDDEIMGRRFGAFHGLELPLVFGNLELDPNVSSLGLLLGKRARKSAGPLSEAMMDYWTNFAKTGDPNGGDLIEWPRYDTDQRLRLILDRQITIEPIESEQLERYQYFADLSIDMLKKGLEATGSEGR